MYHSALQSGFTLIELLITIALIAAIAAVVLPSMVSTRARADEMTARAYGKQLLGYVTMWLADDPRHEVAALVPDCTAPQYVAQGAPTPPPRSVAACQVQQVGTKGYLVRVTSVNGKVFDLNQ